VNGQDNPTIMLKSDKIPSEISINKKRKLLIRATHVTTNVLFRTSKTPILKVGTRVILIAQSASHILPYLQSLSNQNYIINFKHNYLSNNPY
jgi:hypothetical protein